MVCGCLLELCIAGVHVLAKHWSYEIPGNGLWSDRDTWTGTTHNGFENRLYFSDIDYYCK